MIARLTFLLAAILTASAYGGGLDIRPGTEQDVLVRQWARNIIVKLRPVSGSTVPAAMSEVAARNLSHRAGFPLGRVRPMSGGAHVMSLPENMPLAKAQSLAKKLMADPSVEYAEPDLILWPMLEPNDPYYTTYQWHYQAAADEPGGANLPGAWQATTGSAATVVAVIDTGLRPHADIDSNILDSNGKVVPGYDFVSDPDVANDGDARDEDPSDPGDWITSTESATAGGIFEGCEVSDSSWHGTHVAGTIGALSNNNMGVAGVDWNARILPVRALGKCGGYTSDIADGMLWSAGISISGIPDNPNPAKVINLSLGGYAGDPPSCGITMQNTIDAVVAAGTVVVVSAGNSNYDAAYFSPANCNNVITVAATGREGQRAYYSNYGTAVEIAAPGGDTSLSSRDGILSTLNDGSTIPGADNFAFYQGTSMAAPHVAGIAALMLSVAPSLTPAQVLGNITSTARAFPTGTSRDCATNTCGAGIIDAAAAVAASVISPAGVLSFTQSQSSVNENIMDGVITVGVTRTGGSSGAVAVSYGTTGGSATSGTDFTATLGSLSWNDGESGEKTFGIPITDDDSVEANETLTANLSSAMGGAVIAGYSTHTVTLLDDDEDFPAGETLPDGWAQPAGSTAAWSVSSDTAYSGSTSLRSGIISDGNLSGLTYTGEFLTGTISFARKVSSESGWDFLRFYIDGVQQAQWSGEVAWGVVSFPISAGVHELKWQYEKDSICCVAGADAAWIDALVLPLGVVNGSCGSADSRLAGTTPSGAELCTTGSATDVVTSSSSYNWSCEGTYGGSSANCEAPRGYTVTATAGSNGLISPATQLVAYNTRATITVTPSTDYSASASGCSGALTGLYTYTTAPVTTNCSVAVSFDVTDDGFPAGGALPNGYTSPAGSDATWTVDTTSSFAGVSSLKSGAIGHNKASSLLYAGRLSGGTISFYVRTSSQAGSDYLEFYIDGVKKQSWSGETAWTKVSFPITSGDHTMLWRYVKNGSVASGSDAVWIDAVRLPVVVADLSWILLLLD
ncbi:MAG: S8 family serine peptidase [Pseudomonadota bacterium]